MESFLLENFERNNIYKIKLIGSLITLSYCFEMGCSATKNVTVELIDTNSNGVADNNGNVAVPTPNNSSMEGEDIQEILENPVVNNINKAVNGMSFEISFDDKEVSDDSIIQKHPPKRILELQELQGSPPTLEKLQEKLEEAEIRRQQILLQRVQSANLRASLRNQDDSRSVAECDSSAHHLKVPSEETKFPKNPYEVVYI